jgi:hypothetical protein
MKLGRVKGHARIALRCYDWLSCKTEVRCECGWTKTAGKRERAAEMHREHRGDFIYVKGTGQCLTSSHK